MDSEDHVCPVCGQPVETIVKRHKTLGAWVPVWGPGPCRNPDCASHGKHAEPAAPVTGNERQPHSEQAHPDESAAEKS
ncbi:hypothetical protein ACIRU3_35620 [Streptomyces sp. NPDC101151]|uniref:hypothetical protein n=1 Tax=Streptomyces sp. NPDC101151 TaxID=3366115 RepID=UPI0038135297